MPALPPLFDSDLPSLERLGRGKVRDLYRVDADHLLIVVTDRLSAFDVVLPDPIPDKGAVLTRLASFWFDRTRHLVRNHLTGIAPVDVVHGAAERAQVQGRAIVVRRCRPLPIEAVVRGYLIGSGWKDYRRDGRVCGIELPPGLALAARLPEPIFTPATKADQGAHDENIGYAEVVQLVGEPLAGQVRDLALAIYRQAAEYAADRGILIADTKMEFGVDDDGALVLIDELLTPDSSRFWPADDWRPGVNPPSFDKQFVRDYLETLDWNKQAPGPRLPADVIEKTAEKYREAERRLVGT